MRALREQMQQEALARAANGQTLTNWPAIIHGFMARGIPEHEIRPRENVFTYHAWRALGRQVRRGEHGVKVVTFVTTTGKEDKDDLAANDLDGTDQPNRGGFRRHSTATVLQLSHDDPPQEPTLRLKISPSPTRRLA